ncbi:DEAD/DEAH box helicase [Bacillus thuringiensis]|uniref:Helicase SNF2 n=1 Tax=Bacillus thuringiensis TaxID=1428 RepID=A0A9W3TFZ4_BACTU|nr:DEAD/DEAH box helicase [Bacillus thuringiensis]AQY40943.1 helicase SNF2 [Bacillus thuringiensis]MDR4149469.1 DEAD/DEAH box helicase [Bacillus thuringiensis]MEC3575251.1 DEAD/DEAH box helicase [Bacillus thuringiensis]MED2021720.1 DEAD/DEAH box helicase [Bacillus thuringiensis]MED2145279.1 DEAD/DEAH box helicase [Bacillus thuringiensis]
MKLFPHQDRALNETYEHNRVAYYLDMGLGKTFVGSEKMWELNTPYNLLICQKSKIDDWKEHFEQHYEYDVIVFDKQRMEEIPEESVLIVNYERAWRRDELLKLNNFTLMLDESSKIKNDKSKQTKFILRLNAENIILLSGTPTGGKYEELWSQLHLLGWKINQKLFLKQFVVQEWDDRNSKYKITGYKNVERLKAKLKQYGAVFMKTEEVFDLPEITDVKVKIPGTKLYKEFKKHHIVEIGEELLIGDTPAAKKLYLRQLAGSYNENKLQYVKDLVESTNDRIIIFYNFKKEYEALVDLIEKPISTVNGDLKDLTAYEKFENSITLIQYQAGAMGLNLQKANKIVYFTLTDKSELFEQSKKRTHRIGQERPCFYYYLLTDGSIEWRMLDVLKERKDYTDALFEKEEI